jgi:hypothetical protein
MVRDGYVKGVDLGGWEGRERLGTAGIAENA